MDLLSSTLNHPLYKEIDSNRHVLEMKLKVLELVKKVKIIVDQYHVTGKEVVNDLGDGHYKECPCAQSESDLAITCVCCEVDPKLIEANHLLNKIQKSEQIKNEFEILGENGQSRSWSERLRHLVSRCVLKDNTF